MEKTLSAVPAYVLSSALSERVAGGAELVMDSSFDFRKGCDQVGEVFSAIAAEAGSIAFEAWESVRVQFERVAAVRARDTGAVDPAGAANDAWLRVAKYLKEYYGLSKPKADNPDAERMREKRATENANLLAAFAGQSAADLKSAQVEHYKTATPESIAKAKSLDKAIKLIEKAEKESLSGSLKVLKASATEAFKTCLATMVERGDERGLGDLIVLLKRLPDDCAARDSIQ